MPRADLVEATVIAPFIALRAVAPQAADERRRAMRADAAAFARGALALHLRLAVDEVGADGPWTWSVGDAHPGNFATLAVGMARADGVVPVVYDLADVDDEHPAPWHWDLLRLGGALAAFLPRRRHDDVADLVALAVARYREVMARVAAGEGAHATRLWLQDLPPPLRALIARDAEPQRRAAHRAALVTGNGARARLRPDGDLSADPEARATLAPVLEAALRARGPDAQVIDLCARRGGGLGSLGRRRWLGLVRLAGAERFVECKERRPSELAGVLPALPWAGAPGAAALTVRMAGDPCQLIIQRPAWPLLARTRCHARSVLDLGDCDGGDLRDLARLWASLIAAFHLHGWQGLGVAPEGAAAAVAAAPHAHLAKAAAAIGRRLRDAHAEFRRQTRE